MPTLNKVREIADPTERARAATGLVQAAERAAAAAREVADDAARAMLDSGQKPAEVARALGITRSAVSQRFKRP